MPADAFMVDTNVLLDILIADCEWRQWSEDTLVDCAARGTVAINQIVFAELAPAFRSIGDLADALSAFDFLRENLPWEAAFLAGAAHRLYRQRGGLRATPRPDLYIGAHASIRGYALITRDPAGFRSYFPSVRLIAPP